MLAEGVGRLKGYMRETRHSCPLSKPGNPTLSTTTFSLVYYRATGAGATERGGGHADDQHRIAGRHDGGRLGAADRLRPAAHDRLERAQEALRASDLGALLLFDPNNIRYVTSTHIGEWARDKNARCVLLPREGEPILWDFGSAARHHQLYAPWLPAENLRAGVTPMRGAMPDETGVPDALAARSRTSCASAASRASRSGST